MPGQSLYEEHFDPETRQRTYTFPDTLSFQKEPFATVIPPRSPEFKVHRTEGLANSALSHHGRGAKYKQENGVWVKVWEFKVPDECETCGDILVKDRDTAKSYYGWETGKWLRSPLWRGSVIFTPYLCKKCYDEEDKVLEEKSKAKAWRAEQKRREEFNKKNGI